MHKAGLPAACWAGGLPRLLIDAQPCLAELSNDAQPCLAEPRIDARKHGYQMKGMKRLLVRRYSA